MKHFKKLLTEEVIALITVLGLSVSFFASTFFISRAAGTFQTGDIFKGKNLTTGQISYSDPITASVGERIRFNVLAWNQGSDAATNTKIKFDISNPTQPKATITSDNGNLVTDVVVVNPSGATLKIATGSGMKYGPGCPSGCTLTDSEIVNGVNLGTVAVGSTSSFQVTFDADVIGTPPSAQTSFRTGNIVDGGNRTTNVAAWIDPISADPGHRIEFRVTVANTGTVDANNVVVRGLIPNSTGKQFVVTGFISADNSALVSDTATVNVSGNVNQKMLYLPGHAVKYGPGCNTSNGCALSDAIVQGGVNIGTVKPGNTNSYQVMFKGELTNYVTVTPSPSPTPTKSPSPSPKPSKSPSPTPVPSRSPSPSPKPTYSPKPSKSPSPTPTATPVPQCNSFCVTSSQCLDGFTCSWGKCRNAACTKSSNCICQSPSPSPSPKPTYSPKPSKSPSPSPKPTYSPKPSKSPSPSPTVTPTPTATAVPDSKLRVCKYDDKNGNGQIDSGEDKMTWSFRYSYQDKEYQLSTPWWNVFGDKCKTVTVPSSQWIKVWEDGKNDWSLTNILSDGNAVGGTEYNYVSYQNVQKEVSFLNHYSTQPTTTPTITPAPSGEPNSCNGTCGSNYNCKSGLFCYQGYCRNPACQTESSCGCPGATATPVAPQVLSATAPPQLPKTGAEPLAIAAGFVGLAGTGFWLFKKFRLV